MKMNLDSPPWGRALLILVCLGSLAACQKEAAPKKEDSAAKAAEPKAEIWTCPMHPQIRQSGPGKCPICGMDLVRLDNLAGATDSSAAHLPEGHAPFALSSNRIQMIGVKYGLVTRKTLFKSIEAAGRVAFDPELYTAQNEYVEALRQLARVVATPIAEVKHSAQRMVESAKLRLKILGLSDQQIARLSDAGVNTGANLLLTAPGENVWIYAEVFEMDLASIEPGQQVKISGGSLEGKELAGSVASVDRVINPATRTAKVRVLVPNAKAFLRPEAFVNATILSPLGEQTVVPFDAILDSGKESWVFVVKADGHFEPRTVVIKHYAGEEVALGQGVAPGEKIVTSANFLIDSESRLKGVLVGQVGGSTQTGSEKSKSSRTPECPKGQEWHEQMKHCMAKVAE